MKCTISIIILMITKDQKAEINKSKAIMSELEVENKRLTDELKNITQEYESYFFTICHEVESILCPSELKYFDPRKVKQGDLLFGMKVARIEVGTFDPGSFIVSFNETVVVSGRYNYNKDASMGPELSVKTNKINGQHYNLDLVLSGNMNEWIKTLKENKSGEATIRINNITIQSLPHKPATNVATFVSLVKGGHEE